MHIAHRQERNNGFVFLIDSNVMGLGARACLFLLLSCGESAGFSTDGNEIEAISIHQKLGDEFAVTWQAQAQWRESLPILTASVNGVHNISLDMTLTREATSGSLKLPYGWRTLAVSSEIEVVSFYYGNVEFHLCPAESDSSSRSPSENGLDGCVLAARQMVHAFSIEADAGSHTFSIRLCIPFNETRDAVLAATPHRALPYLMSVLSFVRKTTLSFLEHVVLLNDDVVLDVFGSDGAVVHAMQHVCTQTIPDSPELKALFQSQDKFPKGPHYMHKLGTLMAAASAFGLALCVETGSFDGETAVHLAAVCESVITIELSPSLAVGVERKLAWARERYNRDVTLVVGDSGSVLWGERVQRDPRPALFFLDGHYSGGPTTQLDPGATAHYGSPLLNELRAVFARENDGDVIFVDDARHFFSSEFVEGQGYPSISEVQALLCELAPTWTLQVKDVALRIYKEPAPGRLANACCHFGGNDGAYINSISGEHCGFPCDLSENNRRFPRFPLDL